jgi:hypothetical protein
MSTLGASLFCVFELSALVGVLRDTRWWPTNGNHWKLNRIEHKYMS